MRRGELVQTGREAMASSDSTYPEEAMVSSSLAGMIEGANELPESRAMGTLMRGHQSARLLGVQQRRVQKKPSGQSGPRDECETGTGVREGRRGRGQGQGLGSRAYHFSTGASPVNPELQIEH